MEVRIRTSSVDQGTQHLEEAVRAAFERVSHQLSRDFGSGLDHLWIDVELSPIVADHRPPFPFRFQKQVKPRAKLVPNAVANQLNLPTCQNVGHYSVRPDYFALAKIPREDVARYLLGRIYDSTSLLEKRKRAFPNFRVAEFRNSFHRLINDQPIEI